MERCNIVKGYGSRAAALRAGQEEEAAASEILSADIQCDITHSRYGLSSLGPGCTRVYVQRERERERNWIFVRIYTPRFIIRSVYKAAAARSGLIRKLFEKLSSIMIEL